MSEKKNEPDVERVERAKDAAEGTPLAVTQTRGVAPGADVSHADVDLSAVSLDSRDSKVVPAKDQNPLDLDPPPGPQSVEILGVPSGQ